MNSREKKIFFAGVSVGTQLKGWASVGGSGAGDPNVASHIFPNVAQLQIPSVFPIQSFGHPAFRAAVLNVPAVIPVYSYEGSEL